MVGGVEGAKGVTGSSFLPVSGLDRKSGSYAAVRRMDLSSSV